VSCIGNVHHSKQVVRKIAWAIKAMGKNKSKGKITMSNPENQPVSEGETSDTLLDTMLDTILAFIHGEFVTYAVQEGY
jgi:hypothetical protein